MEPAQTPLSDGELTDAVRRSDPDAFKTLYYRYFEAIVRFIHYKTGDRDLAHDQAQDVFTRLWVNRERLDATKSIKSYLYRSAANAVIDFQRRMAREAAASASVSFAPTEIQPDESFELAEHIAQAVANLPEPLQHVFVLNRYQGCKYREIADILGVSVKTVEGRMTQALRHLRDKLAPFLVWYLFFLL